MTKENKEINVGNRYEIYCMSIKCSKRPPSHCLLTEIKKHILRKAYMN